MEQTFRPQSFATPWLQGYHALHLQYGGRSTRKENTLNNEVLKTRFYFDYFTHFSGPNTQGHQEFVPNF